jgi:hypothetical protein
MGVIIKNEFMFAVAYIISLGETALYRRGTKGF